MRPNAEFIYKSSYETRVGELNVNNQLHGRGIYINYTGSFWIGFFENGKLRTGKYIDIRSDGDFSVGECYMKDGERMKRGTTYFTNGEEEEYDI